MFGRMKSPMGIWQKKIWRRVANLQSVRRDIRLAEPIDEIAIGFPVGVTELGHELVAHLIEGLG